MCKVPAIFISYRRGDAAWAGRLADCLRVRMGRATVFRDQDDIPPGVDFVEYFTSKVNSCAAMIVVVGPAWIKEAGENGRLAVTDDPVRIEIALALKRNVPIIPVLCQGTTMPCRTELPGDLAPLSRRNAYALTDTHWDYDCVRLAEALGELTKTTCPWRSLMAIGLVVVLAVAAAVYANHLRTAGKIQTEHRSGGALSGSPGCDSAKIIEPPGFPTRQLAESAGSEEKYRISHEFKVAWEPADCSFQIEWWQDDNRIDGTNSVQSGTRLGINRFLRGKTAELKILDAVGQRDYRWVWID